MKKLCFRPAQAPMTTIIIILLTFFSHCSKSVNPEDQPRIELQTEYISATEVWVRISLVNTAERGSFSLERNGQKISSGAMTKADTLIPDTLLIPKKIYTYKAYQLVDSRTTLISDPLQVTTLDTTSHAIQWQVDTLGVRGTINDVWAFSRDNIWAVGEIYVYDSTGNIDPVRYNLARWDGSKWRLHRNYYRQTSLPISKAIFAFNQNDVWIGTETQPIHWTGTDWKLFDITYEIFNGRINKIWGVSSTNIFIVGTSGMIAHFDGTRWQKQESGTGVDLEDIWGIDEKHIWATGTNNRDGRCVILQYNGSRWIIIYDSLGKPNELVFGFSSLWTISREVLLLGGDSYVRFLMPDYSRFKQAEQIRKWYLVNIRGRNFNDIFTCGHGSEVLHYNGMSWYLYPEIKNLGRGLWYAVYSLQDCIAIGGEYFTGINGLPVVLRGLR